MPTVDSVLNEAQRNSLAIEDFIFHIIDPEAPQGDKVIYLDDVTLLDKQKDFFLQRLRDILEGTQYIFEDEADHLKDYCETISKNRLQFNPISRRITADFANRHDGHTAAGVFVVATVKYKADTRNIKRLVLLVKMDKSASFSYSYKKRDGKTIAVVEEVPNALVESKQAIQKSAVIDCDDNFAWDVLAYERRRPDLADYFQAFLGVIPRQNDSTLTRNTHMVVKRWAQSLNPEEMPPGEDAFCYIGRMLNYLNDNDVFDTDKFIATVVKDPDEDRKESLSEKLRETLREAGIAGQKFQPQPNSLPKKARRMVYETKEGVEISFEGDRDAAGIRIEEPPNGKIKLIIHTNGYTMRS